MTDQDREDIEKMIATELIPAIKDLFNKKQINANVVGANTDENFLHIRLLVDDLNSERIIKVEIDLAKNILYSKYICANIEKEAGFNSNAMDYPNMVKLRTLYIIFMTCRDIFNESLDTSNNVIKVAFGNNSGDLWFRIH